MKVVFFPYSISVGGGNVPWCTSGLQYWREMEATSGPCRVGRLSVGTLWVCCKPTACLHCEISLLCVGSPQPTHSAGPDVSYISHTQWAAYCGSTQLPSRHVFWVLSMDSCTSSTESSSVFVETLNYFVHVALFTFELH